LNKLKSIRNEAAHRINDFSFSLEKISRICSQLQLVDALTPGQLDMIPIGRVKWEKLGFDSPRAKFTLSLCHVMTQILLNARIHTLFIRPNKIKNESLLKALLPARSGIRISLISPHRTRQQARRSCYGNPARHRGKQAPPQSPSR
jgi:hypothetical protein